mmetsp:Transcript_39283/g.76860  ORF Transcript_39283/g.76860 Transcript_39283/m.76860 type:complete len:217 (-) Transcript_39283:93-743(-)
MLLCPYKPRTRPLQAAHRRRKGPPRTIIPYTKTSREIKLLDALETHAPVEVVLSPRLAREGLKLRHRDGDLAGVAAHRPLEVLHVVDVVLVQHGALLGLEVHVRELPLHHPLGDLLLRQAPHQVVVVLLVLLGRGGLGGLPLDLHLLGDDGRGEIGGSHVVVSVRRKVRLPLALGLGPVGLCRREPGAAVPDVADGLGRDPELGREDLAVEHAPPP